MKTKFAFLLLSIAFLTNLSFASDKKDSLFTPHSNIIKIRVLAPVWDLIFVNDELTSKMIGISYERVISKKTTFNIAVDAGQFFDVEEKLKKGDQHTERKYQQLLFCPEFRIYPFNKRMAYPQGFHVGPACLVAILKMQSVKTWTLNHEIISGEQSMGPYGGPGGTLGWQFFLGKRNRLMMDFSFGGFVVAGDHMVNVIPRNSAFGLKGFMGLYIGYAFGK